MARFFKNLPMLPSLSAVETYAASLGALRISGYTGPDGTFRACVEVTADCAAEDVDEESERILDEPRKFERIAETIG